MASFADNLKLSILKGIEALGKGASSLAEGAQQKLSEISLETRRHEILTKIPGLVQELYAQGVELPEALTALLTELSELDAKLAEMRAARSAETGEAVETVPEEAADETEAPAEAAVQPDEETLPEDPEELKEAEEQE